MIIWLSVTVALLVLVCLWWSHRLEVERIRHLETWSRKMRRLRGKLREVGIDPDRMIIDS